MIANFLDLSTEIVEVFAHMYAKINNLQLLGNAAILCFGEYLFIPHAADRTVSSLFSHFFSGCVHSQSYDLGAEWQVFFAILA